jgi:hypothetical protein
MFIVCGIADLLLLPRRYSLFITMSKVKPSAGTVNVSVEMPVWKALGILMFSSSGGPV